MKWAATASIPLVVALFGLLGSATSQAGEIGLSGGYFSPWTGDGGWNIRAQFLTTDPDSHLRWGGELEYRNYSSTFVDVKDVDVQDVLVNGVAHYKLFPSGWTPYGGLGFGLGVNIIETAKLREHLPLARNFKIAKTQFVMGAIAILGMDVPIGTHFTWYTEGRGNIYARIPGDGDATFRNSSGWDISSGFRLNY